ncbi:type I DNA topoisomerase, partial [bacterium AH-315-P15]|nr:type I DNA topoisomerase [bacterium AH-315-P15]
LNEIARAVKGSDKLILATDPDREGEAISWHVLEVLKQKKVLKDVTVERVVFNAVTKKSVLDAMAHPRGLDVELIDAYLARRALDYLVGFTLSPVLWRKLPGSRSAGRVQSVALRIICDRELEIERFNPREYWSVEVALKNAGADVVNARLYALEGKRLDKFDLATAADANAAVTAIQTGGISVSSVESRPTRRNPQPPFTTSTLQQEAARKLGFTAKSTMQTAQRLYEGVDAGGETGGLITYMRTDGVMIIPEAITDVRGVISSECGGKYLPGSPRLYTTKAKNAQEAHEAIRPTDPSRLPKDVAKYLSGDQAKLYELIWKRTVASQMASAELEQTTVDMKTADGKATLRATGQVVLFDGFLKLYQESKDDAEGEENGKRLPKVSQGEALSLTNVTPNQHFTQPPPRFTEASLVKKLEELGIGRPSTYASTLSVLRDRDYVRMDRNRFIPEDKGRLVTAFLESFFARYVQYDFTANLEEQLAEKAAKGPAKKKATKKKAEKKKTAKKKTAKKKTAKKKTAKKSEEPSQDQAAE